MSSKENLQTAFAGESQANRKYLAFAKQADKDGLPNVARLFRAAAEAETVHALSHLRAMGGIGSTRENLQGAAAGEKYEFETMYPPMVKLAEEEGNKPAEMSFKKAFAVEQTHFKLYQEALEAVSGGEDLPARKIVVCDVCGHTHYGDAPEKCPVCGASASRFMDIK